MATQAIESDLPVIYRKFLPDFFKEAIPIETFSTCSNCAMICHNKQVNLKGSFSSSTKCCTYNPSIPNYLIGALFADTDPLMDEGRRRIRERIQNRIGVSPMGVYAPGHYQMVYQQDLSSGFGNNIDLRCPYFNEIDGACTIWKFREAVCSTYFCKTVSAKDGTSFWDSLKSYLKNLEKILATYSMVQNNVANHQIISEEMAVSEGLGFSEEERGVAQSSMEHYKKIWGAWVNKEEMFFLDCFHAINKLDKGEFQSLIQVRLDGFLKDVKDKLKIMLKVPSILKKNSEINIKLTNQDTYIIKLLYLDISIELPKEVIDSFNGINRCDEVKIRLEQIFNLELEDEVILFLYKNNILI